MMIMMVMMMMMLTMIMMIMMMMLMVSQLDLAKPSSKISLPPSTAVKTASVVYAHNHKTLQIFTMMILLLKKYILLVTLVDGSAAL